MAEIPNILEVYNYAPWLFDGAVICLVLGLLFRELFAKSKIGKDDGQSAKLGGIVGFVIGLIIVIGMQTKGLLLIDLWSWLVIGILAVGALLLWKWLIGIFGNEHKWMVTLFVIVMTALIAGTLLGSMPEFTTVTFGSWGEGLMKWVVWLAIIFLIVWALSRMPKIFKGGGGGGEGGGGGGGWWPRWPFGGKKPKTPKEEEPEVEGAEQGARDASRGASDAADGASTAVERTLTAVEKLKKTKDAARDDIANIETKIDTASEADIQKYATVVTNYLNLIKKAYTAFVQPRAIDEFERCHREHDKLATAVRAFIDELKRYLDSLRGLGASINSIEDLTIKTQLSEDYRRYESEISTKHAELVAALKKFDEDTKEAIRTANATQAETLIIEIAETKQRLDAQFAVLAASLQGLIGLTGTAAEQKKNEIKTACTTAINVCELLNEKIHTLESHLSYLDSALNALKNALSQNINTALDGAMRLFEELKPQVRELEGKINLQLQREEAARRARTEGMHEIEQIIATIEAQKAALRGLIDHTENFVRILMRLFTLGITPDEASALTGTLNAKLGGKRAAFIIGAAGKAYENLPKDNAEAEEKAKEKILAAQGLLAAEFKDVAQNKKIVDTAIIEITNAAAQLKLRLDTGEGVTIEQKPKLQTLYNNLLQFLAAEEKIKKVLSNYEEFVLNVIKAHLQLVAAGGKKSLRATTILGYAIEAVKELRALLDLLSTEEIVIREGAEEAEIPPSGGRRTVPPGPIPPSPSGGPY